MNKEDRFPDISLEVAVIQFLETRHCKNTQKAYRNAFQRLVKYQLVSKNMPLHEALGIYPNQLITKLKALPLSESSSQQCLYFFKSFKNHWTSDSSKKELPKTTERAYPYLRLNTQTRTISPKDFQRFLPFLKNVNPVHALAAELYRNVNRQLNHCRRPITIITYVSLREVLCLRVVDVRIDIDGMGYIELYRPKQEISSATFMQIPNYIFKRLLKRAH